MDSSEWLVCNEAEFDDEDLDWEGWTSLDGPFASAPTAVCDEDTIHLFLLDGDDEIVHFAWYDGDSWQDWDDLMGRRVEGQIAAISDGTGKIWVFAQGKDVERLWAIRYGPE